MEEQTWTSQTKGDPKPTEHLGGSEKISKHNLLRVTLKHIFIPKNILKFFFNEYRFNFFKYVYIYHY